MTLEAERGTRLLSAMKGQPDFGVSRRQQVMVAAVVVTMGTAGTLLGIGWRMGDPARAFRLAGFALLEHIGLPATPLPHTALFLGLLHHVFIAFGWGVLLGLLVTAIRQWTGLLASLFAAAAFAVLQMSELPPILRIGYTVTFERAHVVAVSVAIALSLLLSRWVVRTVTIPAIRDASAT